MPFIDFAYVRPSACLSVCHTPVLYPIRNVFQEMPKPNTVYGLIILHQVMAAQSKNRGLKGTIKNVLSWQGQSLASISPKQGWF